jgi:hypothetical protein
VSEKEESISTRGLGHFTFAASSLMGSGVLYPHFCFIASIIDTLLWTFSLLERMFNPE